jgi:hypothetical protein
MIQARESLRGLARVPVHQAVILFLFFHSVTAKPHRVAGQLGNGGLDSNMVAGVSWII